MSHLTCAICNEKIHPDRILSNLVYCACGHTFSIGQGPQSTREMKGSMPLILFSLFFICAVLHTLNWDTHALRIIPLKVKQLTSSASDLELKTIADICKERRKHQCETQALEQAFRLNPKDPSVLLRASDTYMKQKNHLAVVQALTSYYKYGGRDFSSRYNYAVSLGEIGQFRESQKQFRYILKNDLKNPQFNVARSYVELLMKNRDYTTAKVVIEDYRKAAPNSALFLDKELKHVTAQLTQPGPAQINRTITRSSANGRAVARRTQSDSPFDN